ncbi:agamous-like MADS-box protein AGL62 [Bidens hawaiensis]|uniref:agamous-like MADS-box protein AGL62 n=1 Tax=Bidens hawaiensis TaxID=980011 RepID=UPI00404A0128
MKFIDGKNRSVTFSKCRDEVYKRACELCILTGIDIAILITTLSGKNHSFVHPNNEIVKTQFSQQTTLPKGILESHRRVRFEHLAQQLEEVYEDIELEVQRASSLNEMRASRADNVWEVSIDELSPFEAQNVKEQLYELQDRIYSIQNEEYRLHST